jgi:hypothetical protein
MTFGTVVRWTQVRGRSTRLVAVPTGHRAPTRLTTNVRPMLSTIIEVIGMNTVEFSFSILMSPGR